MSKRTISNSGFAAIMTIVIVMAFASSVQMVRATPTPPLNLTVLESSSRLLNGSVIAVDAIAGNVTSLDVYVTSITKSWQGYYGNVTGSIHLDDANNNSFYVWSNLTSINGEVYASRNSTLQWTNVRCLNSTERSSEEAYLGHYYTDGDSVSNTFNSVQHPSFNTGAVTITNNTCMSTNVFVNSTAQSTEFYQLLLTDNSSNVIYTTILENDKMAYNGKLADFQLMVGENEHFGNEGPTTYYFFIEIN